MAKAAPPAIGCARRVKERREERQGLVGLVADQRQPGDAERAVGMDLGGAAPEVLGEMLLADEETRLGQRRAGGEGERKRDLDLASVGPPPLAGEVEAGEAADPRRLELRRSASASAERMTIIASPSRRPRYRARKPAKG